MKKTKILALVLTGILALSMLAACGSSDSGSSSASSSSSSSGSSSQSTSDDNAAELTLDDVWPAGSTVYFDVPAKAGGGTDLYTRYLTQALGELYPDVNFIVTNYDTAEVGREHAKNADPDGLNFLVHHGGMILEYAAGTSNVSAKDDLKVTGVLNLGGPQAIIAKPNAPYSNFQELGEYIADNPGDVVIGCTLGGASQASIFIIIEALGEGYTDMINWVQCGSEADKLTQTASSSIDISNCSIPNAQAYEADGKLTILGTVGPTVATLENMSELVGLELGDSFKTCPEQGVDATWDSCYYVWAPKDTPDNICEVVNAAIMEATKQQSYIDGNDAMATYVEAVDYPGTQQIFDDEWNTMMDVATAMGINIR